MKNRKAESNPKDEGIRVDHAGGIFSGLNGLLETMGKLAGTAERRARREAGSAAGADKTAGEEKVGGILNGLADLAEKLNELSEKGESLSEKGEFTIPSKKGGIKGVYGFSLKMGLGEQGGKIKVEPFGNIRKDEKTGEAVVQEIHEPLIDVFADDGGTTLIAEMPGVGPEDIHLDVQGDVLTISAQKGEKKYRKEILLKHVATKKRINVTCNNGIVTIRCDKAG